MVSASKRNQPFQHLDLWRPEDTNTAGYHKKSDHQCDPCSKCKHVYFAMEGSSSLCLWSLIMAIPQIRTEHLPFARYCSQC